MNNSQFRLLLNESSSPRFLNNAATPSSRSKAERNDLAAPVLGSRANSSIPMTPRSVVSHSSDFVRQVAEHQRAALSQGRSTSKKFRSAAAPKGSKLAAGYQDRAAHLRQQQTENAAAKGGQDGDDKAERIQALEEMVKSKQMDQATFERLRDEIGVGGDLGSTHLVKGLDRKLLERVRRGEDVTNSQITATGQQQSGERDNDGRQDVDEELEAVLRKEVQPAKREERNKRGTMAPPSSLNIPGERMSRDDILKRLKASRAATAKEMDKARSTEPSLGLKFRKVGSQSSLEKTKLVETINGRKREVLVITRPDGTVKRKVRWIDSEDVKPEAHGASAAGTPLGMDIPVEIAAKQRAVLEKQRLREEADDDIFIGVGTNYDPLGAVTDDSDSESQSETAVEAAEHPAEAGAKTTDGDGKPRNYFSSTTADDGDSTSARGPVADATILAALKRAAAIRKSQDGCGAGHGAPETETGAAGQDFLEKLRKREREDAADLDFGFGESRFGDEEEEGPLWDGGDKEKRTGRKRGPKKRKANKEAVSDVMAVIESRRK